MVNPALKIKNFFSVRSIARDRRNFASERLDLCKDMSLTEAATAFPSRNDLYAYMHRYYFTYLPSALQEHRRYFAEHGRGFGEEAFHSMWYLLYREFKPERLLEIGVFRGQVISLWALTSKLLGCAATIKCISPFSPATDLVSTYPDLNYLNDTLDNFKHFDLFPPQYLRALSTDTLAVDYMMKEQLDCIYIDGGHDYEVVLSDYRNAVRALKPGGLLIMDDSSLYTNYEPPSFSFAGHPGPSKVARTFADRELEYIAGVGHQNVYRTPVREGS